MRRFVSYAHVTSGLVAPLSDLVTRAGNESRIRPRGFVFFFFGPAFTNACVVCAL